jgi:phospholipid/cholesterol/gamma-HCH transport system substrate-binding protein
MPIKLHKKGLSGLLVTVIVLVTGTLVYMGNTPVPTTRVTASFERVNGFYAGDDVRILGVNVGKVLSITPHGDQVTVSFEFDGERKVPADTMAAIIAPSLVSGRYIQLAPVYTGGPALKDGAEIPLGKTAVPVEWDQIKDELTTLSSSLGPTDSDKQGALATLINSAANNLQGNGLSLHDTIAGMREAATTIGASSNNLFATVSNLNKFIGAMNASSGQIQQFTTQLAALASLINENRDWLARALSQMDVALRSVSDFVAQNKNRTQSSVAQLADIALLIQNNQNALSNILHAAPTALANFYNIYDPTTHAITGRAAIQNFADVPTFVCQTIYSAGGTLNDCRNALKPYLDKLNTPVLPPILGPLRQGTSNQTSPGTNSAATAPAPGTPPLVTGTLGNLLGVLGGVR